MKVSVIQPYYSFDEKDIDSCYEGMFDLLDQCDDSNDIIVLPEYCDIPAATKSAESFHASIEKRNKDVFERVRAAAIRCNSIVFANFADKTETGYRNTTFAFDRKGNVVGKYYKAHPAPSEVKTPSEGGNGVDVSYSYTADEPYVIEIEGIRFGFMTCYDFYFYEEFAQLARYDVDIIIGCSHQRTDTHRALEIINSFLSYHTNAYLLRSSVSLGEDSSICGCSTVIAPNGNILVDMKSKIGIGTCEIDPKSKYYKPAGFKGKMKSHYEYIEDGRRPWLYRNGGKSVVPFDKYMPYPRLCAHRGLSSILPENTMVSFGAAIALGASEIEFDLWVTTDGELVSCHDDTLDRVSNGTGKIYEKSFSELRELDFGINYGDEFKGLKIPTVEEILAKFASQTIMNIHYKPDDISDETLDKLVKLIRKYDCEKHVYLMLTCDKSIQKVKEKYPELMVCVGEYFKHTVIDRAIRMGCKKVQMWAPERGDVTREMVDRAHEHGIRVNVFYADTVEDARELFEMGVDTVLTDNYMTISNALGIK